MTWRTTLPALASSPPAASSLSATSSSASSRSRRASSTPDRFYDKTKNVFIVIYYIRYRYSLLLIVSLTTEFLIFLFSVIFIIWIFLILWIFLIVRIFLIVWIFLIVRFFYFFLFCYKFELSPAVEDNLLSILHATSKNRDFNSSTLEFPGTTGRQNSLPCSFYGYLIHKSPEINIVAVINAKRPDLVRPEVDGVLWPAMQPTFITICSCIDNPSHE